MGCKLGGKEIRPKSHFHPSKPQTFIRTSSNWGFESLPLKHTWQQLKMVKCPKSISCNHSYDLPASVLQQRLGDTRHVKKTDIKLIIHLWYHHLLLD